MIWVKLRVTKGRFSSISESVTRPNSLDSVCNSTLTEATVTVSVTVPVCIPMFSTVVSATTTCTSGAEATLNPCFVTSSTYCPGGSRETKYIPRSLDCKIRVDPVATSVIFT